MSFVAEHDLSRSSVFKILLGLIVSITVLYSLFAHQVLISSEAFHRAQLTVQLHDEVREFGDASLRGVQEIEKLLARKRLSETPFTYHVTAARVNLGINTYPAIAQQQSDSLVLLQDGRTIEIGIKPDLLSAYRASVVPMILTGVALPISLMFAGAAVFAIVILRKLQRVNHAMNRFLCGEKKVKIPVSTNDDEFDILAIHINFMIEQMEKNEATLKSLSVGIAHDMRTPMARLMLRLEQMLADTQQDDPQYDRLAACQEELELLLSLFNSMLEIAKLNSGQLPIDSQSVSLSTVAQDVTEFLQPIAEQKQQTLVLREDQPCVLVGDRSLLFRAIFNLVENAVKYTPAHGHISVVIDSLGVVISDNGSGISPQDKSHVCEPMYRADKSRSEPGNGIGLALVEAVVRRHKARLILKDNNPGLRARIYID